MTRRTTFWLALFAALLAASAIVLRLTRHGAGDWFGIVGPGGIIVLMISIMAQNRNGGRARD